MNTWLFLSGSVAILSGAAHSYLGEKKLIGPLLSNTQGLQALKSDASKKILRAVWHLPSVTWALMGTMFICLSYASSPPKIPIVFAILIFLTAMAANIAATKGRHVGWPLLLAVSLLAFIGIL